MPTPNLRRLKRDGVISRTDMRPAHGNAIEMLTIQDGLHLPPFFTGPSAAAVATRSAICSGLGSLRRSGESAGLSTGLAGTWTYTHRHALRIGAVALAAVIFVFWRRPTATVTLVIAVLLLVALGLIELIGSLLCGCRQALRPARELAVTVGTNDSSPGRGGRRTLVVKEAIPVRRGVADLSPVGGAPCRSLSTSSASSSRSSGRCAPMTRGSLTP
jgi:hypothetical protein